jgi:hypothetical protein
MQPLPLVLDELVQAFVRCWCLGCWVEGERVVVSLFTFQLLAFLLLDPFVLLLEDLVDPFEQWDRASRNAFSPLPATIAFQTFLLSSFLTQSVLLRFLVLVEPSNHSVTASRLQRLSCDRHGLPARWPSSWLLLGHEREPLQPFNDFFGSRLERLDDMVLVLEDASRWTIGWLAFLNNTEWFVENDRLHV